MVLPTTVFLDIKEQSMHVLNWMFFCEFSVNHDLMSSSNRFDNGEMLNDSYSELKTMAELCFLWGYSLFGLICLVRLKF